MKIKKTEKKVRVQIHNVVGGKPTKGSKTITVYDATPDEVRKVIVKALEKECD